LTYAQARFFEHDYEDAHQWNLANPVMTLTPRINPDSLDLALGVLVRRHEALRVRFDDDHRQFLVAPEEAYTFHEVDLSHVSSEERRDAFAQVAARLHSACTDLKDSTLLRVALLDMGPQEPQRLLVVVHHLLMDAFSYGVFLHELIAVCEALG